MTATKTVKIDPLNPKEEILKEGSEIIRRGGLVIIPTETVYGIAANAADKKAIRRLYKIKRRSKDKPFSIHIEKKEKVEELARDIPILAYKLIDRYWPGPLTLVLKSKDKGKVGLRLPDNEIAQRIIGMTGVPVVCPSANITGEVPPVDFRQAIKDLNGLVDLAIDAGAAKLKVESTVVDLTVAPPQILREGAISEKDIHTLAQTKTILFVCTGNSCRSVMAKGLLEKRLKERNRNGVEVLSAGIMMLGGLGASEETRELLEREGIDVSEHSSHRLTVQMLKSSDLILVMEKLQEEHILRLFPAVQNRLFLLKEFAKINDNNLNIDDPIGRTKEFYEQTFSIIKEAVERISNRI